MKNKKDKQEKSKLSDKTEMAKQKRAKLKYKIYQRRP